MSNPSFLCVPYRYKAGVLYSQVPSSNLGDFTVTRSASNSATRVNAAGFIETVADNVPRLDYPLGGITAGCPALLVEPSAQNLCPRSQEINLWAANTATATPNVAISPDGTQNAELFVPDVNQIGRVETNVGALTVSTNYTLTCFMKQHTASLDQVTLYVSDGGTGTGGNRWGVNVDITGGFTLSNYTLGSVSITSTSVENYGNGWYRIRVTGQITSGGTSCVAVIRYLGSTTNNGTNGVLVWGAQLEVDSVATSYIPTTTAAVTRGAETISKTGVSSLIGQTEGSIYAEVNIQKLLGTTQRAIVDIGQSQNRLFLGYGNGLTNQIRFLLQTTSGGLVDINSSATSTGTIKIAVGYKNNDSIMYVNGVSGTFVSNDSFTSSLNTLTGLSIGSSNIVGETHFLNDRIRSVALYTTRLTNVQLQSLTQ